MRDKNLAQTQSTPIQRKLSWFMVEHPQCTNVSKKCEYQKDVEQSLCNCLHILGSLY